MTRMPKDMPAKISELGELFGRLKCFINKGDETTFKIAHCRLTQAIAECEADVDGCTPLPPQQVKGQARASSNSLSNRSALNHGKKGNAVTGKKRKSDSSSWLGTLSATQLKGICKAAGEKVQRNNTQRLDKLTSNATVMRLATSDILDLSERCQTNALSQHLEQSMIWCIVYSILLQERHQTQHIIQPLVLLL